MKNDWKKKVFRIVLVNLGLFVWSLTFCDLSFSVWHFKCQVELITRRKEKLSVNVVVVSDFVVGLRKVSTARSTRRRAVVVCLLCVCQWVHVLVVGKYVGNNFAFLHDMFVEFVHYPRSTVYEGSVWYWEYSLTR